MKNVNVLIQYFLVCITFVFSRILAGLDAANMLIQYGLVCVMFVFSAILAGLDAANITATYPFFKDLLYKKAEDDEYIINNLTYSYILGSMLGCIGFSITKSSRKYQIIGADVGLIIGYLIMFKFKKEIAFYVGRGIIGFGMTILTLSSPLAIHQIWPNGTILLASAGFCYQLGQTGSDLVNWLDWNYMLLSTGVITCIQMMLVIFTKKESFQCPDVEEPSLLTLIRENTQFLKSILYASLVQSTMVLVGLKPTTHQGPKVVQNLPNVSTSIALVASIISVVIVKIFQIRTILFSTLLMLALELTALGYLIEKPEGAGEFFKSVIFGVYIFTYVACFSSAPLVFTIKSFDSVSRGHGVGLVAFITETLFLGITFGMDEVKDSLKLKEAEVVWCVAFVSVLLALVLKRLLQDPESSEKSPSPAGSREFVNFNLRDENEEGKVPQISGRNV